LDKTIWLREKRKVAMKKGMKIYKKWTNLNKVEEWTRDGMTG